MAHSELIEQWRQAYIAYARLRLCEGSTQNDPVGTAPTLPEPAKQCGEGRCHPCISKPMGGGGYAIVHQPADDSTFAAWQIVPCGCGRPAAVFRYQNAKPSPYTLLDMRAGLRQFGHHPIDEQQGDCSFYHLHLGEGDQKV